MLRSARRRRLDPEVGREYAVAAKPHSHIMLTHPLLRPISHALGQGLQSPRPLRQFPVLLALLAPLQDEMPLEHVHLALYTII